MIFHKSLLPISIAALLVGACSPAEYQVNPPSVEEVKAIPESEQAGYMRILGDLRWDQLTSVEEWIARFPECLTDKKYEYIASGYFSRIYPYTEKFSDYLRNKFPTNWGKNFDRETRTCKNFLVGGIPLTPTYVGFGSNSGTVSKTMTGVVSFDFFDASQNRAFKAALVKKYTYTTDGYCSRYTCWDLERNIDTDGSITATPTPYTISLLDQVKIDTSDL